MVNQKRIGTSRKKRWKRLIRALFFHALFTLILFVAFVGSLALLSHAPFFAITDIVVRGNGLTTKEEIESVVRQSLEGNYYHLFSKRNAVIYPHRTAEEALRKEAKRLSAIDISRSGRHALLVDVAERLPVGLWCGDTLPEQGLGVEVSLRRCYYLDRDGYIYAEAPSFTGTGSVFFTYYGPLPNPQPIGAVIRSKDYFTLLGKLAEAIKDVGLRPVALALSDQDDIEFLLDDGASIRTTSDIAPQKLTSDLSSILNAPEFKTELETSSGRLDYIDFRFGGKIFYKFRK